MKQFKGYEEVRNQAGHSASKNLPAGAYVCKVAEVKYEENDYGDRIILRFDIIDGEYKNFFADKYAADESEDKKWKGIAKIYVPNDDGSDGDAKTKKRFGQWIAAFENSNSGYTWDWDEKKLKGKKVGILFREVGTVIDVKEVKYTEATMGCTLEEVAKGTYWDGWTRFYAKNGYTGNAKPENKSALANEDFMKIPDTDEEVIPF